MLLVHCLYLPTPAGIQGRPSDSSATSPIQSLGVMALSAVLMADLPGHTCSVRALLKLNEHCFLSVDDSGQMILWKACGAYYEITKLC